MRSRPKLGNRSRCAHRRERPKERETGRETDQFSDRGRHRSKAATCHHERGSRKRLFGHGDFRLLVLHLIEQQPRHGYELLKTIEEITGRTYTPSAGVIYPTLAMLEDLGFVRAAINEGSKRQYGISPEGKAYLKVYEPTLTALLARLGAMSRTRGQPLAERIERALRSLENAVANRLEKTLTPEDAAAMTESIEALSRWIIDTQDSR